MTSFGDYIDAENTFSKEAHIVLGEPLEIAIKVWNFLHTGLTKSVDRQATLLLAHYTQVTNGFFGAISSMMRHHSAQFYQCTRYAKEHLAICFFMLRKLPEANAIFVKNRGDYVPECKTKGFQLMKKEYPRHHKAVDDANKLANEFGSHATFMTIVPNTSFADIELGVVNTNLFDDLPPHLSQTRLLVLTDLMLMFCDAVLTLQFDPGMLPLKPEAEATYKVLLADFARIKEAHRKLALQHRLKNVPAKGIDS